MGGGTKVLVMDAQEQLTLDIVVKIVAEKISRKHGQSLLGVPERTLRRYLRKHEKHGALFVKHGNYNRPAANGTDAALKKRVLAWVQSKYFDFNLTHCLEKLKQEHEIEVGARDVPQVVPWNSHDRSGR